MLAYRALTGLWITAKVKALTCDFAGVIHSGGDNLGIANSL